MTYYRIIATPRGRIATKLISGTLWGHMAWAIRYLDGEKALVRWLEEQEEHPWLISSQMPRNMLPKPQLMPTAKLTQIDTLKTLNLHKFIKKVKYIPERLFLITRDKMSEPDLAQALQTEPGGFESGEPDVIPIRQAHNRIDRLTGRTPDEGGLFFEEAEMAPAGFQQQLFVRCHAHCGEQLERLLNHIGISGFGANSSTGCGTAEFEIREETQLFSTGGNRAMSLSHGTLTENMSAPRFRQHTHFGKLGGSYASGPISPFKYPILMMQPGATFSPNGEGPFGELLAGVHHNPELHTVRHHALHLPILFTEVVK